MVKHLLPCVVGLLSLCSVPAWTADSSVLANDKVRVTVSEAGKLKSVENVLASETYRFNEDTFSLETDQGVFSNAPRPPSKTTTGKGRIAFHYEFSPGISADLVYTLTGDNGFFRRTLSLSNAAPLHLKNLVLGETKFALPAKEAVHYVTFIAAPTVEFIRGDKGGLFTGIENPYFKADLTNSGVTLSYEPGLILKAGEGYTSEPQFIGVYKKSGIMIEDTGRDFRYNANASGYKPLDRNEMRAMRAFALDYLAPEQKNFLNINYQFFHPLPQMPRTQKDKDYFTHTIDTFAAIGGEMIIFKPLHPYSKPTVERDFWNVVPDDTNSVARQICDYARSKGLSYGFYMGCAAHGGEGNAGGLNFRPDKPEWKKSDAAGRRAPDNCLACDDYYEWWFTVQNNTIQKYRLSNWSWDPSLGSGMNCYDESHGHIEGKGGYKGWRRCIELMARLKAANPGLFIQGFYGTKNFGLWGLKHVDQHEVYNEQAMCVSTRHNQISDDRQNADGLRFQNNWSMRFRFTPAVTSHALTHRVSEGGFDRELIKAWDYYGWRYGVMSTLAIAGSIMPTILPYETEVAPGYVEFYKKWTRWAREHFDYVNYTEPFGEQVQPGAVDGYGRIKGDHGFIFLFNGNPRPAAITFEVGDEINLQTKGRYELVELYPSEAGTLLLDADGRSAFDWGTKARVVVPANDCFLFELRKAAPASKPMLAGAAGTVEQRDDLVEITGVRGKPGSLIPLQIKGVNSESVKQVRVNGVPQKFTAGAEGIGLNVQFAGQPYVRELDAWTMVDGKPFAFPSHPAIKECRLSATFTLNADVPQLLAAAKPRNFAEMDSKIAGWQKPEKKKEDSYSYHNFIGARPSRLWLVIPFLRKTDVAVLFNGQQGTNLLQDNPSCSAFSDITDLARYGAENRLELSMKHLPGDVFMGPYLLYPSEASTTEVLPEAVAPAARVVYAGDSMVPAPNPRYRRGEGPKILEAKMMGHVTLKASAELRVKMDLPPERIAQVRYFHSGFTWMGIEGLRYDKELQCWTGLVRPGNRASIQENEWIYVWAEGRDGLRSEYHPVKVEWDYCP